MPIISCLLRLSLLITLISIPGTVAAESSELQSRTAYFKVMDTNSGMPDNSVNCITEDAYGFLWVGTWHGLARYDGFISEVFCHDDADSTTVVNDMIRSLASVDDGLYVGTDWGLDFYNYYDGKFHHCWMRHLNDPSHSEPFRLRASRLLVMEDDVLVLTVDGRIFRSEICHHVAGELDEILIFDEVPSPANRKYGDFCKFSNDKIFALSNEGLTLLSFDTGRELYHYPETRPFDTNMNIHYDMIESLLYTGGGIGYESSAYKVDKLSGEILPSPSVELPRNMMSVASTDRYVAFASDGGGIWVRLRDNDSPIKFSQMNSTVPGDAFYSVFIDKRNNLWCGTYRRGLCLYSPELNRFTVTNADNSPLSYNIITAIVPGDEVDYLGLDGGGLDIFDRSSGKVVNYNSSNSSLPGNNIVSMVKDHDNLWLAIYSCGLYSFNLNSHSVTEYPISRSLEPGSKIWSIHDTSDGFLWVGGNGLRRLEKATGKYYPIEGGENIQVMSIADDGKYVWVATRLAGLIQVNKSDGKILERYSESPSAGGMKLPASNINYVFVDSKGNIWFSLPGKSLFCLENGSKRVLKDYDSHNGLYEPRVCSIVEADNGDLWMGTANGFYKYIRNTESFIKVNNFRLPTTFTANGGVSYGGDISFGTTNGIIRFPDSDYEYNTDSYDLPVVFTTIESFNTNRRINFMKTSAECIDLGDDENFFRIDFTVAEKTNPERLAMQYRLDGFDDDWRISNSSRSATYTNVPPGRYRFLVKHNNPDGSWSKPQEMGLYIAYPWYWRWWSVIIWICLASTAVFIAWNMWKNYSDNKNRAFRAEMEKEKERQINDAKLDFYAKIAHELRTPCFLITAQIEELLDSSSDSIRPSSLKAIYRYSVKLNRLINHVIDFRKLDSGILQLRPSNIELVGFIEALIPDYENLCAQKNITLVYNHDNAPIEGSFDADKLELIVTNLISNAFKYTPNGGKIVINLKNLNDKVSISVADNGIGVAKEMQSDIFKPYFRTERGARHSSGDGIGLAFVKELVDIHDGEIKLESEVNQGSEFTVILSKHLPEGMVSDEILPAVLPMLPLDSHAEDNYFDINDPTATRSLLIIDDEPEVGELLARNLRSEFRVQRTMKSEKGLELALTGDFDVVVTDLKMPGIDGLSIIKAIRSNPELANVKIVVLSGVNDDEMMIKALDEGASTFLIKPISIKVLRKQIDKLFQQHAATPDVTPSLAGGVNYSKEEQKFLVRFRKIIEENLYDENFGIELLASQLAMSHSSLYKKIKKMTGMSLVEFITEYRINRALTLFQEGNSNVQKVCDQCGFHDIKTFREAFKKKMGITPKQYILSLQR